MDSKTESRAAFIVSLAVTLFAFIAPYQWHTMPPLLSDGALSIAELLFLAGLWLVVPQTKKHQASKMVAVFIIIFGVAITVAGLLLLTQRPTVSLGSQTSQNPINQPKAPTEAPKAPSAEEIASAIAGKTRIHNQFFAELSQPVTGMYAILRLSIPVTGSDLEKLAFVVQVSHSGNNPSTNIYFGARPDKHEWTVIPGNQKISEDGIRCEVWTFPSQSTKDDTATIVDNFHVFRVTKLNRLEAGAIMSTPFTSVKDVDNAGILIRACGHLTGGIPARRFS